MIAVLASLPTGSFPIITLVTGLYVGNSHGAGWGVATFVLLGIFMIYVSILTTAHNIKNAIIEYADSTTSTSPDGTKTITFRDGGAKVINPDGVETIIVSSPQALEHVHVELLDPK